MNRSVTHSYANLHGNTQITAMFCFLWNQETLRMRENFCLEMSSSRETAKDPLDFRLSLSTKIFLCRVISFVICKDWLPGEDSGIDSCLWVITFAGRKDDWGMYTTLERKWLKSWKVFIERKCLIRVSLSLSCSYHQMFFSLDFDSWHFAQLLSLLLHQETHAFELCLYHFMFLHLLYAPSTAREGWESHMKSTLVLDDEERKLISFLHSYSQLFLSLLNTSHILMAVKEEYKMTWRWLEYLS